MVETPLQIWVLLVACLMNLLAGSLGVVGATIRYSVARFARETALEAISSADNNSTLSTQLEAAVQAEIRELTERQPIGRVVGIIERNLYLYGFVSGNTSFVGAVLLSKAFFGWLSTAPDPVKDTKSIRTLARFYSYTIGGLLSLSWSIGIYEFLRLCLRWIPAVKATLWIA